jgi:hypothetical protein
MGILDKIINVPFPESQYKKEETIKNQIFIHHTVSGNNVQGDINYWLNTPGRIATAIVIDRNGTPFQCFSTKYWGYHLSLEVSLFKKHKIPYRLLDKNSIGVELDSWGGLTKKKDIWYSSGSTVVNNIVEYPNGFRGFKAFEKYTDEQIQTLKELLLLWKDEWNIPITYNDDIWDINERALKGELGVYTHVCVNESKSDAHPQKELINMLKSL